MMENVIFFYLILGIIFILMNFPTPQIYLGLLIFFIFKWIFNYRKCSISWLECKIRGVRREKGYLNIFLDSIIDIRNTNNIYIIYLISLFIIIYELIYKKRFYDIFSYRLPRDPPFIIDPPVQLPTTKL